MNAVRRYLADAVSGLEDGQTATHSEDELRQDVREGLARDTTLDHAGEKA